MPKLFTLLVLGLSGTVALAGPAAKRASDDDPATRTTRTQQTNYYVDPDDPHTPATPGDLDLGVQRRLQSPEKWGQLHGIAEGFLYWSNNVGAVDDGEEEGWALGGRVGARWRKALAGTVLLDTYGYQDVLRHDVDHQDYESTELGIGLMTLVPKLGDTVAFARYEFLYLRSDLPPLVAMGPPSEIHLRLHRLRAGIGKTIIERPNHLVHASLDARYDLDSNLPFNKRVQYAARVTWSWRITERLRSATYYQFSYRDYQNSKRSDWNQSAGVELSYSLTNWADVYASTFYTHNDSNTAGQDYDVFEAGIIAGLSASF